MVEYEKVIRTIHLDTAKDLFDVFSPFDKQYELIKNGFIFRGEASAKYSLLPSALRAGRLSKIAYYGDPGLNENVNVEYEFMQRMMEHRILHRFFWGADQNGLKLPHVDDLRKNSLLYNTDTTSIFQEWLPNSLHELAGLAQHYGLPTRLLDWSRDPFVSLYFASINALKQSFEPDDYMVLWAMNRVQIEMSDNYKLPLEIINPPYEGNQNLRAQQGLLTGWRGGSLGERPYDIYNPETATRVERRPLDKLIYESVSKTIEFQLIPKILMFRFLIPISEARNLSVALKNLNYDASRFFPGFDGIVKSINEELLIYNYKTRSESEQVNR